MTVAMILDVPGVMEMPAAAAWRVLGAALHLGTLVPVALPGPATAPLGAVAVDDEPTWEDAAWQ